MQLMNFYSIQELLIMVKSAKVLELFYERVSFPHFRPIQNRGYAV